MCLFLCFKKYEKKNKNLDDEILLSRYITCKNCNQKFNSNKKYSNHLYSCYLKDY